MGSLQLLADSYSLDELNRLGLHMYVSGQTALAGVGMLITERVQAGSRAMGRKGDARLRQDTQPDESPDQRGC
jgi:hypothetical protein